MMVKPDGVQKGLVGEIIKRFEQRDLKIVALDMFLATREEIDNHYPKEEKWIRRLGEKTLSTYEKYGRDVTDLQKDFGSSDLLEVGKVVRGWLVSYLTSAPMVRMVVQGVHAVDMVRKIVGPTMPYLAEIGTIRGDYSADSAISANVDKRAVFNLAHASETTEEATHEIEYWFGDKKTIYTYKRFGIDE